MSPTIFNEFERIVAERVATGWAPGAVLEIGAVPTSDSLLNLPSLAGATERIGINLDGGASYTAGDRSAGSAHPILTADANDMACFADSRFDLVLCNSVLEHDRHFWKTVQEIRRVARPGAWVIVASPGFDDLERVRGADDPRADDLKAQLARHPGCTLTMKIHDWPGDFYRFSPQAYRDVILAGMRDVTVQSLMIPPRVIGWGWVDK